MISRQLILCAAALFAAAVGVASGAEDPRTRLLHARSLRCTFTSSVTTSVKNGHRAIEQDASKDTATYDNIDLAKHSARVIGSAKAVDIEVWMDRDWGRLWMLARSPAGSIVITTVFPVYAEGTDQFVVLEADHYMIGTTVAGIESYGTCRVWD
jgi:hypothetical protein